MRKKYILVIAIFALIINVVCGTSTVRVSAISQTVTGVTNNDATAQIKGLTKGSIISGASYDGDSGGPYVYENKFAGIHEGIINASTVLFTPYTYAYNAHYYASYAST